MREYKNITFLELYNKIKVNIKNTEELANIKKAYYYALEKHKGMVRLNGDDFIIHPLTVANILNDLNRNIKVCDLKKNNKHRTNDLIDSNYNPVIIDKKSDVFHYLTRMQDEVHRYTISYHRTIRSKGAISSILDNVGGIGEKRKKELIKTFGSVNKMRNASIAELTNIIPENIAINLKEYLNSYKEEQKKSK